MSVLKIENKGLTSYYLNEKIGDSFEETGIIFNYDEETEEETIELHYKGEADLEKKLSTIFLWLLDK